MRARCVSALHARTQGEGRCPSTRRRALPRNWTASLQNQEGSTPVVQATGSAVCVTAARAASAKEEGKLQALGASAEPQRQPLRGAAVAQRAQGGHRVISTLQGMKNKV